MGLFLYYGVVHVHHFDSFVLVVQDVIEFYAPVLSPYALFFAVGVIVYESFIPFGILFGFCERFFSLFLLIYIVMRLLLEKNLLVETEGFFSLLSVLGVMLMVMIRGFRKKV